jgi:four helix bundle protein
MANIAEGFERGGRLEFRQYLSIAKGSSGEVRSLIYHACDAGLITQAEFAELDAASAEVGRIIGGLRRAVAKQAERQRSIKPGRIPQSSALAAPGKVSA